jgi:hypothetical protein
MQMIVAKLMLDDRFRLLCAMNLQLMRTDFDIMALRKITPSGRAETSVKRSFMPKRPAKMIEGNLLDPSLQLLIVHRVPSLRAKRPRACLRLELLEL